MRSRITLVSIALVLGSIGVEGCRGPRQRALTKDVQLLRIPGDFPEGEAKLWTGIFDAEALRERQQDVRMRIVNADAVTLPHEPDKLQAATIKVARSAAKAAEVPGTPSRPTPR